MAFSDAPLTGGAAFSHEALFYSGLPQYVANTAAFIRDGVAAGEPVLVVVDAGKIDRLRETLEDDAAGVVFADMADVGLNPARIIPAWQEFVSTNADRGLALRGIGEPIWAERSPDELVECQRHESLLNVAFADAPPFRLLCPYDVDALPADVLDEARRSHAVLQQPTGEWLPSRDYAGLDQPTARFETPLTDPPPTAVSMRFGPAELRRVRSLVGDYASKLGLTSRQRADLMLAATEAATNSFRHGDAKPTVSLWDDPETVYCEIRDGGRLDADPLVGRRRAEPDQEGGRGLWLVNQLCDLVQLRSLPSGTVVRMHVRR